MNEWMNDLFNVQDVGSVYTIFRAIEAHVKNARQTKKYKTG